MIITWIEIAVEKPKPGQVALTYSPSRPGPAGIEFEVLVWSKALGKPEVGAFGRMQVGKRFTTVEAVEPEPTHYAPLSPYVVPVPYQDKPLVENRS